MRNLQMRARLGVYDRPRCQYQVITRGATVVLKLEFASKVYNFDDIKQITYLFKQGNNIERFTAIDYDDATIDTDNPIWEFDSHFYYDEVTDCLLFTIRADETVKLFEPTELRDLLVDFEIAIGLNTKAGEIAGAVIVEKQPQLYVIDSLYSQVLGVDLPEDDQTTTISVVSETTYCSNDLYCKN